jgi:hypothetical protein
MLFSSQLLLGNPNSVSKTPAPQSCWRNGHVGLFSYVNLVCDLVVVSKDSLSYPNARSPLAPARRLSGESLSLLVGLFFNRDLSATGSDLVPVGQFMFTLCPTRVRLNYRFSVATNAALVGNSSLL